MPNSNGKILDKLTRKSWPYLIVIFIHMVILCIYDLRWLVPSLALFAILVLNSYISRSKNKDEIVSHIESITSDVNSVSKSNLINSPIPLVLMNAANPGLFLYFFSFKDCASIFCEKY